MQSLKIWIAFTLMLGLLFVSQAKGYEIRQHHIERSFETGLNYQYILTLPMVGPPT